MLLPSLMLYILLCKLGSGSCLNMLKINSNHLIRSLLTSTFSLFLCPPPLLLSPSLSPSLSFSLSQGSRNYSMHPLGVFYDKANEGAGYNGTSGNDTTGGDAVMPNETFLYRWTVPEAVAPTDEDPPCITWMYYSSVDLTKDVHSGRYSGLGYRGITTHNPSLISSKTNKAFNFSFF